MAERSNAAASTGSGTRATNARRLTYGGGATRTGAPAGTDTGTRTNRRTGGDASESRSSSSTARTAGSTTGGKTNHTATTATSLGAQALISTAWSGFWTAPRMQEGKMVPKEPSAVAACVSGVEGDIRRHKPCQLGKRDTWQLSRVVSRWVGKRNPVSLHPRQHASQCVAPSSGQAPAVVVAVAVTLTAASS